ncbi:MAG: MbnP family protein [Bacteroidota bacterium]
MKRKSARSNLVCAKTNFRTTIILALWLLSMLGACYEPEEGCLDVTATNFEASADEGCGDCCNYPVLQLQVSHGYGDTTLRYGDPYDLDGQPFRIRQFIYYISELRLKNSSETVGVVDSIQLSLPNSLPSEQTIEDNFTIISPDFAKFSYDIGTFRSTSNFDSLRFFVGVTAPANEADVAAISTGSSDLAISSDSLYSESDGYIFNRIRFQKDTITGSDTLMLEVVGTEQLVEIVLPFKEEITLGQPVCVKLRIDYKEWLKGIDFATDNQSDMISKIVSNTPDVFSVIE